MDDTEGRIECTMKLQLLTHLNSCGFEPFTNNKRIKQVIVYTAFTQMQDEGLPPTPPKSAWGKKSPSSLRTYQIHGRSGLCSGSFDLAGCPMCPPLLLALPIWEISPKRAPNSWPKNLWRATWSSLTCASSAYTFLEHPWNHDKNTQFQS